MINEKLLLKHLNAVSRHFDVSIEASTISVPDKFEATNYPKTTQQSLRRLKKHGFHIQTTIQ